uniref:DNA excision repair protein ERCC-6-like n=1 Tax=Denticeps clupeoides TaxID=299321 RepID=A0AAY4AI84_9TELE
MSCLLLKRILTYVFRYIREGKDAARQGNMTRSLELFEKAYAIQPSEKLNGRLQRLQEVIRDMAAEGSVSDEEEFVNVNNSGLMLFKELYDKLYEHQKEGVAFLYRLYKEGKKGGILADDMGLGKTIQVISFLSGMYDAELVNHCLLIMPTSLIKNWVREFAMWTPGMRVKEFHGTSKAERNRNLERIQRRGGVIITTYQMLINNWELLSTYEGREFCWDYVILDEAHKIKSSSTKTAKSAHSIQAKHRLLLTGTPVQNNLREMWALFDFACQGSLLGTSKTFKTEYENPITRAREKDATAGEKALGLKISENLMNLINPYFLRRTKAEVQIKKQNSKKPSEEENLEQEDKENASPSAGKGTEMPSLTRKNDLIVWTYLSSIQEDIYKQFISLEHIKELLMTTKSPLAELNVLKKLCDHPRLLSARAVSQLGLEEGAGSQEQEDENESAASRIENIADETLISESGKLMFLMELLQRLREEGRRTLVFSRSRKMLDIIERLLLNKDFKVLRIDGTVTHLSEREKRIAMFQTSKCYSVFLLTTQVGGVGLTLTAANRVVIYDPSWNPATDAQAVDRAYRIGQMENVIIYRLITCGTVEEKIYRRQVFKDSLIRQTTGDKKNPFRYFSKQELKELFKLEDTRSSSTQLQLQTLHSHQRRSDSHLDEHIAHLHTMYMFGISDHDLMFSHEIDADEDHPEDQEAHHYIENRVLKAQELMKAESELHGQLLESIAQNTEPAWLRTSGQRGSKGPSQHTPLQEKHQPQALDSSPAVVDLTQSGSSALEESQDDRNADEKRGQDVNVSDCVIDQSSEAMNVSLEKQSAAEMEVKPTDGSIVELDSNDYNPAAVTDSTTKEPETVVLDDSVSSYTSAKLVSKAAADSPSQLATEGDSFQGNFNLQLEDSETDMFSDEEAAEVSAEFQLHMDAAPGEERLDQNGGRASRSLKQAPGMEAQQGDSPLFSCRKKKAQVLYDSDREENSEAEEQEKTYFASSPLAASFKDLGSSTPKTNRSVSLSEMARRRRSLGNTSVASRRSFVESVIEEVEDMEEEVEAAQSVSQDDMIELEEENGLNSDAGLNMEKLIEEPNGVTVNTENDDEGEVLMQSEFLEDMSEAEDVEESLMEEEEPSGETLNTENDESELMTADQSEFVEAEGEEEEESRLEESSGNVELASSEMLDQCAPLDSKDIAEVPPVTEEEKYDLFVKQAKQSYSEGKIQEALSSFLSALDIKSGDPEIQLMTIQLYRKLGLRTSLGLP